MTGTDSVRSAPSFGRTSARRAGPVVVAVGPDDGDPALYAAHVLSARLGTGVAVVTALEPLPVYGPVLHAPLPAEIDEMRTAAVVDRLRRRVRDAAGAGAEWPVEVRVGPRARVVAGVARERESSLIVMGLGAHRAINRLFGETTLQTVRLACRPVLAVADDFLVVPRFAVAAVDFSASSLAAVRTALPLLAEGATLYLVHVWHRSEIVHPTLQAQDAAYERRLPELFARLERELAVPAGVSVKAVPLVGTPAEEVLAFAASHKADLIVAGTHGHGWVERLFVGSVVTRLMRGARCSVLTAPEPSVADVDRLERSVTGTYESHSPDAWAVQLEGFARRNAGRRTALEIDDDHLGAQLQETGYALLGATYDHHDRRAELMLGDPTRRATHLTRTIQGVTSVAVATGPNGRDEALRMTHDHAQTLLTSLTDAPR